jgi:hypothetical protein
MGIKELRKRFLLPKEATPLAPLAKELAIPLISKVRAEGSPKFYVRCHVGLSGGLTPNHQARASSHVACMVMLDLLCELRLMPS